MKIGVMTSFSGLPSYYSLTGVVLEQIEMIQLAGHKPVLIACENFEWPASLSKNSPLTVQVHDDTHIVGGLPVIGEVRFVPSTDVEIRAGLPVLQGARDYSSAQDLTEEHTQAAREASDWIQKFCLDLPVIFTHDLMHTGWNVPYNIAVRNAAPKMTGTYWFHWVHSVPGNRLCDYWRLPPNGMIVYPNERDRIRCAEHYKTIRENVLVVPHSKDFRRWCMTNDYAKRLATDLELWSADFVQVFPVPTDRIESKGIYELLGLFSCLKSKGKSVRLICCNSWCNTDENRSKVAALQAKARGLGLSEKEVFFTSTLGESYEIGVTSDFIADLMRVSNIFINPSKSETFGLTMAEAALSGVLLVTNSNLPMMAEIAGVGNSIDVCFGSYQQKLSMEPGETWEKYLSDLAKIIVFSTERNEVFRSKTHFRKTFCYENVWSKLETAIQTKALGAAITVNA